MVEWIKTYAEEEGVTLPERRHRARPDRHRALPGQMQPSTSVRVLEGAEPCRNLDLRPPLLTCRKLCPQAFRHGYRKIALESEHPC